MFSLLFLAALCASCLSAPAMVNYSFSLPVGGGSGPSFSTEGQGRITAVRVWEISSAYITGIQLRYGSIWSELVGRIYGTVNEIELYDGETIVQISGKYSTSYVYQVIFVTSMGRSLAVGQQTQISYNFYPDHRGSELLLLSGRYNGHGITSLGAHWGSASLQQSNSTAIGTY